MERYGAAGGSFSILFGYDDPSGLTPTLARVMPLLPHLGPALAPLFASVLIRTHPHLAAGFLYVVAAVEIPTYGAWWIRTGGTLAAIVGLSGAVLALVVAIVGQRQVSASSD